MGKVLYEKNARFRDCMHRMDAIALELSGLSVVNTLYNDGRNKAEVFEQLSLSNPAIFMVEYALAQTLINANTFPDLVLGTSMGTFAAAAVSGCLSMEDALNAVIKQAQIFEENCVKGSMIAILADQSLYHQEDALRSNSHIASFNFPTHFVISIVHDRVSRVENFLREKQITYQKLPVNFAFHSPWIDEARIPTQLFFQSLEFKPASIPIVCCAHTTILNQLPPNFFWDVAQEPVRFQQTIGNLERDGHYQYIDVGPAGTLATFLKYGLPKQSSSKVFTIMTPFGQDLENLAAVINATH